jgi:hypothetical protein
VLEGASLSASSGASLDGCSDSSGASDVDSDGGSLAGASLDGSSVSSGASDVDSDGGASLVVVVGRGGRVGRIGG